LLTCIIVNRWLSIRFNILSSAIFGVTGIAVVAIPGINAALAGMALTFAASVSGDVSFQHYFSGMPLTVIPDPLYDSPICWSRAIYGGT
jgi:hypothetical protein